MNSVSPLPASYWLPLQLERSCYVVARDWQRAGLPLIPEKRLAKYIEKHFKLERVVVDLGDGTSEANIFVPVSIKENAYILVDEDLTPIDRQLATDMPACELLAYFDSIRHHLAYSEALLPEQQAYLWTDFLQPTLSVSAEDSLKHSATTADWRVIQKSHRVLLCGPPGVGKTTLMRRLAIELADPDGDYAEGLIPVYIQLRLWSDAKSTEHLVRRELSRLAPASLVKQLHDLASHGKVLFLLDGLDEVELENRELALEDINSFIGMYPSSRFVISARPGTYLRPLQKDSITCEILPWTYSQIKELCWHKLTSPSRSWDNFWSRLVSEPDICDLSRNPLALSLLVARYLRDDLSPHFVTEIATSLLSVFIDEWDAVRGVQRSLRSKVTPLRKIALLRHLAGSMFAKGQQSVSVEDFRLLASTLNVDDEPLKVLRSLAEETGIVVESETHRWSFSHRSYHEYLAACFIVDKVDFAQEHFYGSDQAAWHRVLRFATCLASDSSRLLTPYLEESGDHSTAVFLANTMSQNLLIERSTISGFGLYIFTLLRQLLEDSVVDAVKYPDHPERRWNVVVRLPESVPDAQQKAESICDLARAVHKTKDGVANRELTTRFRTCDFEPLVKMSGLFETEGVFECSSSKDSQWYYIDIRLVAESTAPKR